jgi:hypothetical protein
MFNKVLIMAGVAFVGGIAIGMIMFEYALELVGK